MFLVLISTERAGGFLCYLLFPYIACFFYTLLPSHSPRDTLELLGQIVIKQNIRY